MADPFKDLASVIREHTARDRRRNVARYRHFTVKTTVPLTLTSGDGILTISEEDDDVEVLASVRRLPLAAGDVIDVRQTPDAFVLVDVVE